MRARVRIVKLTRGPGGSCKKCKKPLDPRVDKGRRCRACRDECIGKIKRYGKWVLMIALFVVGFVLKNMDDEDNEDNEDDDQLT